MKFDEAWKALVTKSPSLINPEASVTISDSNLRALLEQFHGMGVKTGSYDPVQDFSDLFNQYPRK